MKPNDSEEVRPTISIESIDLLICSRTNSREIEGDSFDRFFEQLLDTRVSDVENY